MLTKYPRTLHLPWSEGIGSDDKVLKSLDSFEGQYVVVTEKMDGENTTMYRDHIHARSISGGHHPSRNWVKGFHASIKHNIPEGWRVCGENMYARHSIAYADLSSYFLGFSIWDENNICLGWDTTLGWFYQLGITPVPELYRGFYNLEVIEHITSTLNTEQQEGVVIRNADSFTFADFNKNVAKYVRANHVQTDEHWTKGPVIPNLLK